MNKPKAWVTATKKKPPKPRPQPVVSLTDAEREEEAESAAETANIHLKEARAIANWGGAPNACIHSAYYAMYFTATAALFRAGGVGKRKSVPQSHEHVIEHYAKLSEKLPPPLNESGKLLNRARDLRIAVDYYRDKDGNMNYGVHGPTLADARELTDLAEEFVANWNTRWSLT